LAIPGDRDARFGERRRNSQWLNAIRCDEGAAIIDERG
jgi:hypothetical protein